MHCTVFHFACSSDIWNNFSNFSTFSLIYSHLFSLQNLFSSFSLSFFLYLINTAMTKNFILRILRFLEGFVCVSLCHMCVAAPYVCVSLRHMCVSLCHMCVSLCHMCVSLCHVSMSLCHIREERNSQLRTQFFKHLFPNNEVFFSDMMTCGIARRANRNLIPRVARG